MGSQPLADRFTKARDKIFAGATAATIAIPLAFGGLTANDAYAQDTTNITAPRHELLISDQRDVSRNSAQLIAAQLSKNAQTLLLFGPAKESFNEVKEAAEAALTQNGNTLNWVVVASGKPELAFYTNGLLTHTILNPQSENLDQIIIDQLAKDLIRVTSLELTKND